MRDLQVSITDWENVYRVNIQSGGWSYLSRVITRTLNQETNGVRNKRLVEPGSGSGLNSLRLAKIGARVALLDLSFNALSRAKNLFMEQKQDADFIQGTIFEIPLKNGTFDVVWNAGVIEHWVGDKQVECLREMIRLCRPDGGKVITLNPYSNSILHMAGKRALMKVGKYHYTDEVNIKSLEDQVIKASGRLIKAEYSIGFFVLFAGLFLQLTSFPLGKLFLIPFWLLNGIFTLLDMSFLGEFVYHIDKLLSKRFGGYLLVSVISAQSNPGVHL